MFKRLGLGFSSPHSKPDQRYCYVHAGALQRLLETPGALELLLEELGEPANPGRLSLVEQLACLRQRAIHLAVTASPFKGLSLEEIVVLSAYSSDRFNHTAWKREITRQPSEHELTLACHSWLKKRVDEVIDGQHLGKPHWPLVGFGRDAGAAGPSAPPFVLGVAPICDVSRLQRGLEPLAFEVGFAHEHYVACAPATALQYLSRHAASGGSLGWDAFVLDRRLRSLGLGLLLVEHAEVMLYLPARYHAAPTYVPAVLGVVPPGR
jgi:hypothetical protein